MPKVRKVVHQVTIDEYLASLEELFPDGPPPAPPSPYTRPWTVKSGVPVFPDAIDGTGKNAAAPAPVQVVWSRRRRV